MTLHENQPYCNGNITAVGSTKADVFDPCPPIVQSEKDREDTSEQEQQPSNGSWLSIDHSEQATEDNSDQDLPTSSNYPTDFTDEEVLEQAHASEQHGKLFSRLWDGDIRDLPNKTLAIKELCYYLAKFTRNNHAQMDRLYRASELGKNDSDWNKPISDNDCPFITTFGRKFITEAINCNN